MREHKLIITTNNINIENSYSVKKNEFHKYYDFVKKYYPECCVPIKRSYTSLDFEWVTHNDIYFIAKFFKINKLANRVKSVDLNYPLKWYIKVGYIILGILFWIFIK